MSYLNVKSTARSKSTKRKEQPVVGIRHSFSGSDKDMNNIKEKLHLLDEAKLKYLNAGCGALASNEFLWIQKNIDQPCRFPIQFEFFAEAKRVLDTVRTYYGNADKFQNMVYGDRITATHANNLIKKYLAETGNRGKIKVRWSKSISGSARLVCRGISNKYNRPDAKKYYLEIKPTEDNPFITRRGIFLLADHEISTHFLRYYNDGLQPWFPQRSSYQISRMGSYEVTETEEGLASLHTVLNADLKLLYGPAILYYASCMATKMGFRQLFHHLSHYLQNPSQRWKHVMRIKQCLPHPENVGGSGKDQCYFAGAVKILKNLNNIDFRLLMSGKLCLADLPRVKRVARTDGVNLPYFMKDMDDYLKNLRRIAAVNKIPISPAASPSRSSPKLSKSAIPSNSPRHTRKKSPCRPTLGLGLHIKSAQLPLSISDSHTLCEGQRTFLQHVRSLPCLTNSQNETPIAVSATEAMKPSYCDLCKKSESNLLSGTRDTGYRVSKDVDAFLRPLGLPIRNRQSNLWPASPEQDHVNDFTQGSEQFALHLGHTCRSFTNFRSTTTVL